MLLYRLVNLLFELYKLALLVYVVLILLNVPTNRWIALLQRIIEPALKPIRRFIQSKLSGIWQSIDWSVLLLYLLVGVAESVVLGILRSVL